MYPTMSQSYFHPMDFNIFASSSHLHHHLLPHTVQSLRPYPYDYQQHPLGQFDTAKPTNHFRGPHQLLQLHQSQNTTSNATANHPDSPYLSQNLNPRSISAAAGSLASVSGDDTVPGSTLGKQILPRVPKFDRTFTDALEDELFDESSSVVSHSVNSQNPISRHTTPGLAFGSAGESLSQLYVGGKTEASRGSNGPRRQLEYERQHPQSPPLDSTKDPSINDEYPSRSTHAYDPLVNQSDAQRLSSTAVADRIRRLQVPDRTTVSPREAFLDCPDNADFRERRLFSSSASPHPETHGYDTRDKSLPHAPETESTQSNDDDFSGSENLFSYPGSTNVNSQNVPEISRSTTSSNYPSGLYVGDVNVESSGNSDSEYEPSLTASRRTSRGAGYSAQSNKTFACPECGKRYEKSQPLQVHRRHSHGKGTRPATSSQNKLSNMSHRCTFVDPVTRRICNTPFSRP